MQGVTTALSDRSMMSTRHCRGHNGTSLSTAGRQAGCNHQPADGDGTGARCSYFTLPGLLQRLPAAYDRAGGWSLHLLDVAVLHVLLQGVAGESRGVPLRRRRRPSRRCC